MGKFKPPYYDLHFYKYLLRHKYLVGIGFQNDGKKLNKDDDMRIELPIKSLPAYVVVKSQRYENITHAVYWDGEKILDPNPEIEGDGLPLNQYEVISWFPIVKINASL